MIQEGNGVHNDFISSKSDFQLQKTKILSIQKNSGILFPWMIQDSVGEWASDNQNDWRNLKQTNKPLVLSIKTYGYNRMKPKLELKQRECNKCINVLYQCRYSTTIFKIMHNEES